MPLIHETLSTLRRGARMLVNWPVNQIGLSLEPDKESIIYLRQKKSKRNVIIFLFSRACGDEEDSDDYWILTVFYYTLYPQPELWGASEGSVAPHEVHPFSGVEGALCCGFIGVDRVCLPTGTAEADARWVCEKSSWGRTMMCTWLPTGMPWKQRREVHGAHKQI